MGKTLKGGYLGRGGSDVKGLQPSPSPSSYSSAETYGKVVNGTVDSQMQRVFGSGSPYGQSNAIVGVQGQLSAGMGSQKGGKRRRSKSKGKSRGKRKSGGLFGAVLNQAIVPFGILAMQQSYGRRSSGDRKTKKYYKNRNSRRRY